jgi:hypothetical protein
VPGFSAGADPREGAMDETGPEVDAKFDITDDELKQSEQAVLRAMQSAYAFWGAGYAIMRVGIEEWATRRQQHLQVAIRNLAKSVEIEDPQRRADAITHVVRDQFESTFQDWAAAGLRAMTYAGAQMSRQMQAATKEQMERMQHMGPGAFHPGAAQPGMSMPGTPMQYPGQGPFPGQEASPGPESDPSSDTGSPKRRRKGG